MPAVNAQREIFRLWERLLAACLSEAALLPHVEPLRSTLEDILHRALEAKTRKEDHEARRYEAARQLTDLMMRGQEAARCVRDYAKSQLGTRNELLVKFGAAPIRPRRT